MGEEAEEIMSEDEVNGHFMMTLAYMLAALVFKPDGEGTLARKLFKETFLLTLDKQGKHYDRHKAERFFKKFFANLAKVQYTLKKLNEELLQDGEKTS